MRSATRLRRLEEAAGIDAPVDKVTAWCLKMADASDLLGALGAVARTRAHRRLLLEGRARPDGFDPPDFEELRAAELGELQRLWAETGDFLSAIEQWANEPDDAGWPRQRFDQRTGTGFAEYQRTLAELRRNGDNWRTGERSARWRADNPEWRPGMTDDEFYSWELTRLAAAAQEWGETQ